MSQMEQEMRKVCEGFSFKEFLERVTNEDLFNIFRETYPEMPVSDYRPLDPAFAEDRLGITIFMDNGDILLYFPEVKNGN